MFKDSIESLLRNEIQQHKIDMANEIIDAGRFNMKTTNAERRDTLEEMLKVTYAGALQHWHCCRLPRCPAASLPAVLHFMVRGQTWRVQGVSAAPTVYCSCPGLACSLTNKLNSVPLRTELMTAQLFTALCRVTAGTP